MAPSNVRFIDLSVSISTKVATWGDKVISKITYFFCSMALVNTMDDWDFDNKKTIQRTLKIRIFLAVVVVDGGT